jgi:hypothetical protein
MEYYNHTPFQSLPFSALDVQDREFHVIVLRGTFYIYPDEKLCLASKHEPLVLTDQYCGELNKSSVVMESDLAPFKPQTDVLVSATAHAPGGKLSGRWQAGIRIGDHTKMVEVTGPRSWQKDSSGQWALSAPQLITSLPLHYEYAYGGTISDDQDRSDRPISCYEQNPIGIGHYPDWKQNESEKLPAPQIESVADPICELGKSYIPQGFGPIGRPWLPRRLRAGTFDDAWLENRWPYLPKDFDFSYYNCAHPDLTLPWLNGDEQIELLNLTPDGTISFQLPALDVSAIIYFEDGTVKEISANLDTLIIDAHELKANLVWRLNVPSEPVVDRIEMRLDSVHIEETQEVENG